MDIEEFINKKNTYTDKVVYNIYKNFLLDAYYEYRECPNLPNTLKIARQQSRLDGGTHKSVAACFIIHALINGELK